MKIFACLVSLALLLVLGNDAFAQRGGRGFNRNFGGRGVGLGFGLGLGLGGYNNALIGNNALLGNSCLGGSAVLGSSSLLLQQPSAVLLNSGFNNGFIGANGLGLGLGLNPFLSVGIGGGFGNRGLGGGRGGRGLNSNFARGGAMPRLRR